ncbi:sensor histidine kinase [Sulfurimonas aquatica]|uniref:histidine kinase n=1 Tax=Sulfurimonas aquatica TaxID=2672570 RepID=A0A975GCG1_9BACT|nr:HAMP domain-containing sensor histidine kinase [Sulfurimonas aquatica]QSZ41467.1 sensor histidine kinase [Sulfurimonas aquatica]
MNNFFNSIYTYILHKSNTITIQQANIFTTLFIFIFTILFAYLLITENYHDYERALYSNEKSLDTNISQTIYHADREKKLKTLLIKNTIAIVTLAFILFGIMLGFYKIFNTLLQRDMQAFLDFFKETAHSEQVLNPNVIFFKEFKTMVSYANSMVDTISEKKRDLEELNLKLEDKVKEKTANLQETNANLVKEKELRDNILQAQKEFLRHTIHETNTPLSVILTSIDLLSMNNKKDRHLSKIEAATKNIFNIYDDLSYLVKKDQVEYPRITVDLDLFLKSRIDFFSEVAQLSKLEFVYTSSQSQTFIYFNETKLQRVIDNTLTNAIKYTLANEKIYIGISVMGSFVELSAGSKSKEIKDTDKIFDAYYREEEHIEGFGIGLRLVKSICEEENVKIYVDSSDEKTTFRYRFKMMGE